MNERIKELAKQADNYAYKMNPEQDSYGRSANPRKFQQDRDAKFAELIVRECAGVCVEQRQYQPKEVYAQAVLSHFGVEE
jgi:hypothetical protein